MWRLVVLAGLLAIASFSKGHAAQAACAQVAPAGPASFASVVAKVAPAVVKLVTLGVESPPAQEDEASEFRLGEASAARPRLHASASLERSSASGFVFDRQGHILTSAHAIRDTREVWAFFSDGRRLPAQVLGLDLYTDVALLRVADAAVAPVVTAGQTPPCAGEWVAAMGAPFGFSQSVAVGVVSAYPRHLPDRPSMIQTDAALNPGSSGGPLFNIAGEVVGMSSMVYSSTGGYIGIAFALPIDVAMRTASQLMLQQRLPRSHLGARLQVVTPDLAQAFGLPSADGALVARVEPAGPAFLAGLRSGDVVLSIASGETQTYAQLQERIAEALPGARLPLRVWRQRKILRMEVAAARGEPAQPSAHERVAPAAVERLGLALAESGADAVPRVAGLHVMSVEGAAARAGILPGDRVLAVNEMMVQLLSEFDSALAQAARDAPVALLVQRGGAWRYLPVGRPGAWIPLAD